MNKEHFLIELKIYLKPLSYQQQALILEKYETIFEERLATGETEEAIAKELGKPRTIAEEILQEFDIDVPEKQLGRDGWQEFHPEKEAEYNVTDFDEHNPYDEQYRIYERPRHSPFVRFCQIAGILALNFFMMIWVFFGILMGFLGVWIAAIACLLSPIIGGYAVIAGYNDGSMFQLFLSIFLFGGSIIALLILKPLTAWFLRILKHYFVWNISVLRGDV
ncbi:DUF1700 domain-containing protein [Enterococcus rivorum]|uniref:DUF1700 domain-containing protein n=1 Tax=Enterococcus rivorum TaxID=762845 RepID=A0A1E5L1H6_9ENTE|nr:DUF1700 domain-containing protein [Enterococcus rivorum]MBP2097704.1 putative membrane protein [Enterococcus rivorum]OEH83976.1 hypothetical protein BCR26_00440 [Enterococcus rivorum]